jgi:thiol-disulfide isomerase/thioredoxin
MLVLPTFAHAQLRALPNELSAAFKLAGINVQNRMVAARDFSVTMLDGTSQSLRALKGKVVFLNFWATWCGPCRAEMPSITNLYQHFKNSDFVILAIDIQESKEDVAAFMSKMRLPFPAALDSSGKVSQLYNVSAIPTTYIIDRDGYVVAMTRGSMEWNTPAVFSAIDKLLAYKH